MTRWPQFRLDPDTVVVWQTDGGIAPAAKCNSTHIEMARSHGATLLDKHPVNSLKRRGEEILIDVEGTTFSCSRLIVAADAWTNEILAWLGHSLPLTITQEQVTYFACSAPEDFSPQRLPIWIWMDEPSFYGFPIYGEVGPKVGQDVGGREVTAHTRSFEPDASALDRVVTWMSQHLPGALGPVIRSKTCLYTMPPDRDFVLDAVPGNENVFVALGAAHGFKFSALFGRILEELAMDGSTRFDISAFAFDRPSLTRPDATASFLI
jgi:sarcosine oxidase